MERANVNDLIRSDIKVVQYDTANSPCVRSLHISVAAEPERSGLLIACESASRELREKSRKEEGWVLVNRSGMLSLVTDYRPSGPERRSDRLGAGVLPYQLDQ
jgi:hypothetical protein